MVLQNMGMEREIMKKEQGQVLPLGKKSGDLSVTGQETLRGGIVMRGNKTGTGLKGNTGSPVTGKKRTVTETIVQENVTWVMRMIGIEGSLLQDLGAGPEQCQKKIIGLDPGMWIMEREDACHQSDTSMMFILLWQVL